MDQGNLILFSTSYWHSKLKFRRHQWASIASKNGYKVTYVNPTFTILSFIKDTDSRRVFFNFFKKPLVVNENLVVLTMPPLIPFQRKFLWIDKLNRKIVAWIMRMKLSNAKKTDNSVFFVYEPNDIHRILKFPGSCLVYECVDEHSEYPVNLKVKSQIIAMEQQLMAKADLLSVSSLYLLDKKKSYNQNNVYVPNGVNFELFQSALLDQTVVPSDVSSINGPVILYVGAIMEWFDYELLLRIAENKTWNVVLIGPQTVNVSLFKDKANIHTLGVKEQALLPAYLKKADVCIIPFLINDLVKGVNPLKLYEYLAAGKPVVSTALPDVIPFEKQNYVHIAHNHNQFIEHLDYLITNKDSKDFTEARVQLAREYSWENIYRKLFDKVNNVRQGKSKSVA